MKNFNKPSVNAEHLSPACGLCFLCPSPYPSPLWGGLLCALCASAVIILSSLPAFAACKSPDGEEGKLIYNNGPHVPQFCNGENWIALGEVLPSAGGSCTNPDRPEGTVLYNDGAKTPQFCNGSDWVAMVSFISQRCNAPPLCPNVGDVCDDGNPANNPDPVFAGLLFYNNSTCRQVFVPQTDQSSASQWKTSAGTNDITNDSVEDGKINDAQVANSTDFPAFKLCKDLGYGGYDDWYLPARTELDLLWRNKTAIGSFTTDYYWSSTEYDIEYASYQNLGNGIQTNGIKTSSRDVRCIRSQNASFGIMHCTPPTLCPNVGDVCDDGNAGTTNDPVFAGFMVYNDSTCEPLYVTQDNQSTAAKWKITGGNDDIANDSVEDGKINHSQVIARADYIADPNTFPAFKLCEELTQGGYTDWYLPARTELDLLWRNSAEIGNFTAGEYLSSTESDTDYNYVWGQALSSGSVNNPSKTGGWTDVRCVRRN